MHPAERPGLQVPLCLARYVLSEGLPKWTGLAVPVGCGNLDALKAVHKAVLLHAKQLPVVEVVESVVQYCARYCLVAHSCCPRLGLGSWRVGHEQAIRGAFQRCTPTMEVDVRAAALEVDVDASTIDVRDGD